MSISLSLQFFYNCLDADPKASSKQMINTIIKAISEDPFLAAALFNYKERENLKLLLKNGNILIEDNDCHPGYELFANIRNYKATLSPYTKDKLSALLDSFTKVDKELKAFDKASTLILGIVRCYGCTYADTAVDNLCEYYDEKVKLDVSLNILSLLVHQQISAKLYNNNQLLCDPILDKLSPDSLALDEQALLPYDFNYIISLGTSVLPYNDEACADLIRYINTLNEQYHELLFDDSTLDTIYCSAHYHMPFVNLCNLIMPKLSIEEEQTFIAKLKAAYESLPCALCAGLSTKALASSGKQSDYVFDENFPLLSNLITYLASKYIQADSHEDLMYQGCLYIQAHPEVVDEFIETVIIEDDNILKAVTSYKKIIANEFKVVSLDEQKVLTIQDQQGNTYSTPIFDEELLEHLPSIMENDETIICMLLPIINEVTDYICMWYH